MGDHPTTVSRGDNFVTEGGSLPRKTKKMLQLVFKMINIITMTIVQEEAGRVGIERGAIGKGSRGIDTMIEERGKGDNAHSGGEEVSEEARESSREEVAMIKGSLNTNVCCLLLIICCLLLIICCLLLIICCLLLIICCLLL
jgi:hypothetical protein